MPHFILNLVICVNIYICFRYEDTDCKRPQTIAQSLKECDSLCFPNLKTLMRIVCTLPVTSAHCERSASVLRRLNNYTRASMTQQRLSNLALLHIHYDTKINLDDVIDLFQKRIPVEWN